MEDYTGALLTRLGVTGRFARDCLLAAAVTAVTFVLMTLVFWSAQRSDLPFEPWQAIAITVVSCGQAALLCIRRIRPNLCLILVVALQIAIIAVAPDAAVRGIAPLIVAYTVGAVLPARRAFLLAGGAVSVETVAVAVAMAMAMAMAAAHPDLFYALLGHLGSSALSYFGPALLGSYVATRRGYLELARAQADEAIRMQQATTQAAIGAERSRMARELHDVAAHHLSAMVVQAAAVERLIDRDPAAAKDGVAFIRAQGKETCNNLRLLVGVLRSGPAAGEVADDVGNAPVPGLAMLDDLVADARDLATPVELIREGNRREIPPLADVALYRVVQESLTNARQHAPGAPVRVVLRFLPTEVSLEVVNACGGRHPEPESRTSTAVGLVGMAERAQLIGAGFAAGPTPDGGWCVMVTLPTPTTDEELA